MEDWTYEPDAVVDQPLVRVNDIGGEPVIRELAVENCFTCAWVSANEAAGMEFRLDLHFVMVASCFKLKHTEDIVAIHSVGNVPEPESSGDRFDVCGQLPDNISQFDGQCRSCLYRKGK